MLHWLQLVSLANTPASASSADSQKIARLEREIAELRKGSVQNTQIFQASRSRKRFLGTAEQSAVLALPAPASSSQAPAPQKSRGKGRKGKGGKGDKKVIDKTKTWQFTGLLRGPRAVRDMFHGGRDNCFNFQEGICTLGARCKRDHRCIDCGGQNPYNECHCLQQKIQNLP